MSDEYMNKEFTMMMKHEKHKSFVADNTKVVAWFFFVFSIQSNGVTSLYWEESTLVDMQNKKTYPAATTQARECFV